MKIITSIMTTLIIPFVVSNIDVITYLVNNNIVNRFKLEQFFLDNMATAILTGKSTLPLVAEPISEVASHVLQESVAANEMLIDSNVQKVVNISQEDIIEREVASSIQTVTETDDDEEGFDFDKRIDDAFNESFDQVPKEDHKELLLEFLKESTTFTEHHRHFIQSKMIRSNFKKWLLQRKITIKIPSEKDLEVSAIAFFRTMKYFKNGEFSLDNSDYNALINHEKTPFPAGEKLLEMKVRSGFSGCVFNKPYFSAEVVSRKRQKRDQE